MKPVISFALFLTVCGLLLFGGRNALAGGARGEARTPPRPQTRPTAKDDALRGVARMAAAHPNPFVRERVADLRPLVESGPSPSRAEPWNVGRWSIDPGKQTFKVTLADPQAHALTGTVTRDADGVWNAKFNDDEAISRDWIPPTDAKPTLEQARAALLALCDSDDRGGFPIIARALRAADQQALAAGKPNSGPPGIQWSIDLENRSFTMRCIIVDFGHVYWGKFGWNKDHQWDAWVTNAETLSFG